MEKNDQLISNFHAHLFVGSDREKVWAEISKTIPTFAGKSDDLIVLDPDDRVVEKNLKKKEKSSGEITASEVREFVRQISLSAFGGRRVGIVWNCERLNDVSANILLKTLEEPPGDATIILVSETDNLLATIKSRCQIHRIASEATEKDHTFSYSDFFESSLAVSFKKIDEIVKNDQADIFLSFLTRYFEEKMIKSHDRSALGVLERILISTKRIKGNANKKLTLENLILEARDK